MVLIIIILLVLLLVGGAAPAWPYSRDWGYGPSAMLFMILLILLVVWLARAI